MQIVIDIPEEDYNALIGNVTGLFSVYDLIGSIKQGTPLPKGHGRLIDEKKMLNRLEAWNNLEDKWDIAHYLFTRQRIIESPTIIEADKEK